MKIGAMATSLNEHVYNTTQHNYIHVHVKTEYVLQLIAQVHVDWKVATKSTRPDALHINKCLS